MRISAIEPSDGWKPGDRAYCVQGSRLTTPTLEEGRVYLVEAVIPVPNHVADGLVISGVQFPDGAKGAWSSRFLKLHAGKRALAEIDEFTTPVWIDAYWANAGLKKEPAHDRG